MHNEIYSDIVTISCIFSNANLLVLVAHFVARSSSVGPAKLRRFLPYVQDGRVGWGCSFVANHESHNMDKNKTNNILIKNTITLEHL